MPAKTTYNLRIRDLLTGKTLVSAKRGRTLMTYWEKNYVPGKCEWWWQYETAYGWAEIPVRIRKKWHAEYLATKKES